ncbi:hypothetical protein [Salinicola rhizosphaerae]|uniref:Uncharacterized protein n=1 Tax=Salinicola rhizosphaerae TaxID=1443141 RepID=A0ABQ3DRE6_9GAMM|nr:hypothetical protein [Salinicola rhizosphaerae]GHB13024.1 hypothetical protein GCM10009038_08860 [Salinicola rhizosphaerae]
MAYVWKRLHELSRKELLYLTENPFTGSDFTGNVALEVFGPNDNPITKLARQVFASALDKRLDKGRVGRIRNVFLRYDETSNDIEDEIASAHVEIYGNPDLLCQIVRLNDEELRLFRFAKRLEGRELVPINEIVDGMSFYKADSVIPVFLDDNLNELFTTVLRDDPYRFCNAGDSKNLVIEGLSFHTAFGFCLNGEPILSMTGKQQFDMFELLSQSAGFSFSFFREMDDPNFSFDAIYQHDDMISSETLKARCGADHWAFQQLASDLIQALNCAKENQELVMDLVKEAVETSDCVFEGAVFSMVADEYARTIEVSNEWVFEKGPAECLNSMIRTIQKPGEKSPYCLTKQDKQELSKLAMFDLGVRLQLVDDLKYIDFAHELWAIEKHENEWLVQAGVARIDVFEEISLIAEKRRPLPDNEFNGKFLF